MSIIRTLHTLYIHPYRSGALLHRKYNRLNLDSTFGYGEAARAVNLYASFLFPETLVSRLLSSGGLWPGTCERLECSDGFLLPGESENLVSFLNVVEHSLAKRPLPLHS